LADTNTELPKRETEKEKKGKRMGLDPQALEEDVFEGIAMNRPSGGPAEE